MRQFEYKFYAFKKPLKVIIDAETSEQADVLFYEFIKKNISIVNKEEVKASGDFMDIFNKIFK